MEYHLTIVVEVKVNASNIQEARKKATILFDDMAVKSALEKGETHVEIDLT